MSRRSNSSISTVSNNSRKLQNSNETIETLSVSSQESERIDACEGNKFNINLVFIGLVFVFLYMKAGVILPKTEWSKETLISGLNKMIPDFKLNNIKKQLL